MSVPDDPLIFHITHVDNLPAILAQGGLWSDAERIRRALVSTNIGHVHIKNRRLQRPVQTRAGGNLGDYVPFNFCPRSVMLYVVHRGHQDYQGGQEDIIHLVSSVSRAVALGRLDRDYWADVKEERQAEFLVHEFFPWEAVTEIAAMSTAVQHRVQSELGQVQYRPPVAPRPAWYY